MHERAAGLLTRRRLGGAALVLAGIAVLAVVLWPLLRDDDGSPAGAPGDVPVRLVSVPELGLAFAHPRSWTRSVEGRVIRLRSPRGAAVMTFASPVAGRHPKVVKAALVRALRTRLERSTILREGPGRLGKRTADTVELSGFGPAGQERALALVASTEYRTYAVTVLTPGRPSRRRLAEAAQTLASVTLSRPRKR